MVLQEMIKDVVIALCTGLITWFFSRKKQLAEVRASELDNVEKAIQIWREMAEDMGTKVDELSLKCHELSVEIEQLREENKSLKEELRKAINSYNT